MQIKIMFCFGIRDEMASFMNMSNCVDNFTKYQNKIKTEMIYGRTNKNEKDSVTKIVLLYYFGQLFSHLYTLLYDTMICIQHTESYFVLLT